MVSASQPNTDTVERAALIHHETVQLGVLVLAAVAAFFVTKAVAESNRNTSLRDAAEWYRRGQQQIELGQVESAIDAFRRARVRDRNDKRYVLALAGALALDHDYESARRALIALRESAPEDPDINLQLARLAVEQQDGAAALRFYHNALYAPWRIDQDDTRRRVRLELIGFLLSHNQGSRALSELLAVSGDLPDRDALHVEVGQLFAKAGDHGHALEQFQRALRLAPRSQTALAGAGAAAFELGNYPLASTYLHQLPAPAIAGAIRDVVDLVVSHDPLTNRLGSAERRRRLATALAYVQERLATCLAQRTSGQVTNDELAAQAEAHAFETRMKPNAILEQDTVEMGVDLIDRLERRIAQMCGPLTTLDRALALIGRQHGADAR